MSTQPGERFTRTDVSQAVSRQLQLPPELQAIADLSGKLHYFVNQSQSYHTASLDGSDFRNLVMSNLTPELARLLDPGLREQARREEAKKQNVFSAQGAWAHGHWLNGQWMPGGFFSGGDGGSSGGGRANYQTISYNSSQSLQGVTESSYARTPFAAEGISYGTFSYLRGYDRNFTGQDILSAANNNRALGFSTNDRGAMRDQATINHYDPNKDATNQHMRNFQSALMNDPEYRQAVADYKNAPAAQKKAALARVHAIAHKHADQHGVNRDAKDQSKPANARGAIGRHRDRVIEHSIKNMQNQNRPDATQDIHAARQSTDAHVEANANAITPRATAAIGTQKANVKNALAALANEASATPPADKSRPAPQKADASSATEKPGAEHQEAKASRPLKPPIVSAANTKALTPKVG